LDASPYFVGRELSSATGDPDMHSALALRFSVYCRECRFLPEDDYPNALETDAFDSISTHFGAFNRAQELVGYVRLVPPNGHGRLPWEARFKILLAGVTLPARAGSAEISRLMVRADYRRRRGDTLSGVARPKVDLLELHNRRSASPQILLALYREMYRYSVRHGLRHWYAAMERPLARSLKRLDFAFRPVGHEADYFGPVTPYLADLRELESHLARSRPELLAWMQAHPGAAP
jgi:N-acyl amino acid synthase of PEP-CTERM/exosortase system